MNIECYENYEKGKCSEKRIQGMHQMLLNALDFELNDVIFNMIVEWRFVDVLCVELKADDLLQILIKAKKYENFQFCPNFNQFQEFDVYDNIYDCLQIYDRVDVMWR